ncbi:helix-turn-helix domain-containing protein [Rhizobium laguerreae]|uniref:helix-turn-helix domain-containing protein n=1 Tax=Rhizobium laguerreae TaxID=1076926 RepID=UPI0014429522|nr:helix-turn-helix domain-containing protein [Rhizobium laguerreae]
MKILTIKQAAEMLSISVSTLRALVRAGEIAFVPRGVGAVRQHMGFDPGDIEDYIKRTKTRLVPHVKPTSPTPGSFLANRQARLAAKSARKAGR